MSQDVASQLDAAYQRAKKAFWDADIVAYMELFAPELEYVRADGSGFDYAQMRFNVQVQMSRVRDMDGSSRRHSLAIDGDRATEVWVQDAWTDFFSSTRWWRIRRTFRCHWAAKSNGWQIVRMEVLREKVA